MKIHKLPTDLRTICCGPGGSVQRSHNQISQSLVTTSGLWQAEAAGMYMHYESQKRDTTSSALIGFMIRVTKVTNERTKKKSLRGYGIKPENVHNICLTCISTTSQQLPVGTQRGDVRRYDRCVRKRKPIAHGSVRLSGSRLYRWAGFIAGLRIIEKRLTRLCHHPLPAKYSICLRPETSNIAA